MEDNSNAGLEEAFLEMLRREKVEISIYLVNGIRLKGIVSRFNNKSILLKNGNIQLIRLDAVSTIMPTSSLDEKLVEAVESKFN